MDGKEYSPGIQQFPNGNQQIGKPTVTNTLRDSVLIALLDLPDDTATSSTVRIRVIVQPMVVWLWIGGGVMAFGALLAAFPGHRRNPIDPVSAPVDTVGDGDGDGPPADGDDDRTPVGVGS